MYLGFNHVVLDTQLSCLGCLTRIDVFVTRRKEVVVAFHLATELIKFTPGWSQYRNELNTYQPTAKP